MTRAAAQAAGLRKKDGFYIDTYEGKLVRVTSDVNTGYEDGYMQASYYKKSVGGSVETSDQLDKEKCLFISEKEFSLGVFSVNEFNYEKAKEWLQNYQYSQYNEAPGYYYIFTYNPKDYMIFTLAAILAVYLAQTYYLAK